MYSALQSLLEQGRNSREGEGLEVQLQATDKTHTTHSKQQPAGVCCVLCAVCCVLCATKSQTYQLKLTQEKTIS